MTFPPMESGCGPVRRWTGVAIRNGYDPKLVVTVREVRGGVGV